MNDDYDVSEGVTLTLSAETIRQARLEVELDDMSGQRPNDYALIVCYARPWPERPEVGWTPPTPSLVRFDPEPEPEPHLSWWDRHSMWWQVQHWRER